MKTGTKFLLLLLAFLCVQGSVLEAQNQTQMKTAVSSALDAFLGAGQQTINTGGIGQNGEGQTILQGKSTFFGTANVDYSAEFYTNSSSKVEKLIANFPAGSSITDPIFKTMLGKKLSDVIPQKYLLGIGVKQIIINFEGSNNVAKGLKLSLTGKQGLDLFDINGITLNKILSLAGMNLKDVIFTIEAEELGLTPTIKVGLGADVDANGLAVQVRGNVSTSLADSEISIKVDNVTLNNVMSNLVGQSGFNTLPIPNNIKNAQLGNGIIKVLPLKLKLTAVANMTIQGQVVGSVDILVGKADPAKKKVAKDPKPEDLASQDAINKATAALANNTKKPAGSGWTATKPSNQGGGAGMIIGDHRSAAQLQANVAGNAARAAIETAKKEVEAANPQDNKSSAGGLDFHVGFSLNMDNIDLGQIHSSLKKLESWRKYIPSGVLAIVISSYKGEVNTPVLVSLGETNVRKGLNIIAGFAMPSDVKNAIGLQAGVLKGMISLQPTNLYVEASLNCDLKFLVAKDQYISSTAPFALDPGFLGLANQNKHHVMASLRKVSIGIAPLGGFEMNIKGMMDVYLNGPGTQPLQFYLMGYYTPPGTVGFGVALMGEWNDPLKIYSQTVPGLDILKGLKVGDLAFQLGADFLTASGIPIPEVYVSGLLGFNGIQANGALGVDVNTPQNSMLEAGMQNLTAWKIAEAFTPQQAKTLLNNLPSVAKKSLQTGLNNAELKIVPMNYTNTLTGITYEQGLGIGGDVDIAGWNANMVFRLNATGMTAKGALDPVNIKVKGQEIFKFTGKTNNKKGPEAAINLTVDNLVSTTDPLILIDGKASFFGAVSTGALMKFDGDEFVLESESKILNQFSGNFKLRGPGLKNLNDLHLEVDMEQSMMDALANEVGKVSNALAEITGAAFNVTKIHFEGNLGINDGIGYDFLIEGEIAGQDVSVPFSNIEIDPNLIENLAKKVFDETKDVFLDKFGAVVDVIISTTGDVYNTSVSFASDLGSDAGDFFISLAGAPSDIISKGISGLGSAFGIGGSSTNTIKPYRGPNTAPVAMITNKAYKKVIGQNGTNLSSNSSKDNFWALLPYKETSQILIYNVESEKCLTVDENGNITTTSTPNGNALWNFVKSTEFFSLKHQNTAKFLAGNGTKTLLSKTKNDAALWKGGATDYILPEDITRYGKAKAIAEVYLDSKYRGSMAYLRNKNYSKKEYGSIFPSAELSSLKFYQQKKYALTFNGQIKMVESVEQMSVFNFNDEATSVIVKPYNSSKDVIVGELYRDSNHSGDRMFIYNGDKKTLGKSDLKPWVGVDEISSIKVRSGYEITLYYKDKKTVSDWALYPHRNYTSNKSSIDGSLNDDVASVTWGKKGDWEKNVVAVLYDDVNYKGDNTVIYTSTKKNLNGSDLDKGVGDGDMSSFEIFNGHELRFYDNDEYANAGRSFSSSVSSLNTESNNYESLDDDVNTVQWAKKGQLEKNIVAILYDDVGYKGKRTTIYTSTKKTLVGSDLDKGVGDGDMSSFKITPGYRLRFYDNDEYENSGRAFTSSVSSLDTDNNNYESLDDDVNKVKWEKIGGSSNSSSGSTSQSNKKVINPGNYFITAKHSNKVIEVSNFSKMDGGNIQQWQKTGTTSQQWKIEYAPNTGNKYYQIKNINSKKCLDIKDFSTNNGANAQQWGCSGGNNQQWWFKDVGGGYVEIVSRSKDNFVLDVDKPAGSTGMNNGTNVHLWSGVNNTNQKFKLTTARGY